VFTPSISLFVDNETKTVLLNNKNGFTSSIDDYRTIEVHVEKPSFGNDKKINHVSTIDDAFWHLFSSEFCLGRVSAGRSLSMAIVIEYEARRNRSHGRPSP